MPSTVLALRVSRTKARPFLVSVLGGGFVLHQESQDASAGPFVNVSRISTGPCASRYSVCSSLMRRSGTPATEPSSGPMSSISLEKTGWRISQKAFHSVWIFSWSAPKERKSSPKVRFERWRLATRWNKVGNMLYVAPLIPAASASLLRTTSGCSCMRLIVSCSSLSISVLTGCPSTRLKVLMASLASAFTFFTSLQYCA
mmetsp:Transcript_74579/g.192431  ORF Transcript_74579/g.192431 Transcript_74579/m.192431 type:complete len:200 (+) Transcript_74579:1391-1990(+)